MGRKKSKSTVPEPPKINEPVAPTETVDVMGDEAMVKQQQADKFKISDTKLTSPTAMSQAQPMGMEEPSGTMMAKSSKKKKPKAEIQNYVPPIGMY